MKAEILGVFGIAAISVIGALLIVFNFDPLQLNVFVKILFFVIAFIAVWSILILIMLLVGKFITKKEINFWPVFSGSFLMSLAILGFFLMKIFVIFRIQYFAAFAAILLILYLLLKFKYYNKKSTEDYT